jgi:hypothetical protein
MKEKLFDFTVSPVDTLDFIVGFILIVVYSFIVKYLYEKYSLSVSNKLMVSSMFPVFAVAIFVIVITIKSSLVLSLGLVGALSIIRFRTAIKEPEQLIYYLILTAISICVAADNYLLSFLMIIFIIAFSIYRKQKYQSSSIAQNDLLVLKFTSISVEKLEGVTAAILKHDCNILIQNYHIKEDFSLVILRISNMDISVLAKIEKSIQDDMELDLLEFQLMSSID